MPRLREKLRLRQLRFLGITLGIPDLPYMPSDPGELRGYKLKFYDLTDTKIGELGSDAKTGAVSNVKFELMGLGCGAFSFTIDETPKRLDFLTEMLINGDFEDSEIPNPPVGWTAGNLALLTTQAGGKSGKCMRIQENGSASPYATQSFTVSPGAEYEITAYIKAGTEASYSFYVMDVDHSQALFYDYGEAAGDWSTGYKFVIKIPPGCMTVKILFYQQAAQGSGTTLFVDECSCKLNEYVDAFEIGYRTRVDIHPYFDSTPWFTGFIQTLPQPGKKKPYEYTGFGFFEQLDWVTVTGVYEDQDIANIVKDIIQNTVAPNTQIVYNASKVETTGYTIDKIDFYVVSAKDAIQDLADMASGYEFGVDDSREFYFRAIDTTVYHSYWAGKHFQEVEIEKNPHTVRNRLFIKIGLIQGEGFGYIKEGSNCIGYEEDAASIAAYGLREDVKTAPDVLNEADAREWAKDILSKTKDPEIKAKIKNVMFDQTRVKIIAKGKAKITTYDGTEYTLFIKKVGYSITAQGITGDIDLE